jgi:hypothetical protein
MVTTHGKKRGDTISITREHAAINHVVCDSRNKNAEQAVRAAKRDAIIRR